MPQANWIGINVLFNMRPQRRANKVNTMETKRAIFQHGYTIFMLDYSMCFLLLEMNNVSSTQGEKPKWNQRIKARRLKCGKSEQNAFANADEKNGTENMRQMKYNRK